MGQKLAYLAEFTDANGVHHTAINFYDRTSGIVDMMRDVKFEDGNYPLTDVEMLRYQREHELWKKLHPTFIVKPGKCNGEECFKIWNTDTDNAVAFFFSKEDADKYVNVLNENDTYLDDTECLDDDPLI